MDSLRVCSFWTCLVTCWKRRPHLRRGESPVLSTRVQCECRRYPVTNDATKGFVTFHHTVRFEGRSVERRVARCRLPVACELPATGNWQLGTAQTTVRRPTIRR